MSHTKRYRQLREALDIYQQKLNDYSEERFTETPMEGTWSYSEVYAHITSSSYLSLRAAQKCAENDAEHHPQPAAFRARLVLWAGRLPKGRKVPASIAKRVEKISKSEALEKIQKVRDKMEEVYPMLAHASSEQKLAHPRLGHLDAKQWFHFVNIHCWHHVKQLQRIEALFAPKAKN